MKNSIIKYLFSITIFLVILSILLFPSLKIEANIGHNRVLINANTSKANNTEIKNVTKFFIKTLKEDNINDFKKIVSPKGLIIIRNFVSGGNGTRGKNIRDYYKVEKIPRQISFPVKDEIPIKPKELFEGMIKFEGNGIEELEVKGINFSFKDNEELGKKIPSTNEALRKATLILSNLQIKDDRPRIFKLGDKELALTDSQLIDGIVIGGWAIFENINKNYYLRAIIDLR